VQQGLQLARDYAELIDNIHHHRVGSTWAGVLAAAAHVGCRWGAPMTSRRDMPHCLLDELKRLVLYQKRPLLQCRPRGSTP
jgi:hypothetical protein